MSSLLPVIYRVFRPPLSQPGNACRRLAGFSLVELMAVLVILAVLGTAALPLVSMTAQRSKEQQLRHDLRQVRDALDAYKRAADEGRIAKKSGESGYPKSLNDLVKGVDDLRDPNKDKAKIYFLRRIPRDPMAPPFVPGAPGVAGAPVEPGADSWGLRSYASPPDEPRAGDDVFDVYSRNDGIGLNGVPYRQW